MLGLLDLTSLYARRTFLVFCPVSDVSQLTLPLSSFILIKLRFHTIMNHSQRVAQFGVQLDYQGIVLLMWGASIPLIYYGFYCDRKLQHIYWGLVNSLYTT